MSDFDIFVDAVFLKLPGNTSNTFGFTTLIYNVLM